MSVQAPKRVPEKGFYYHYKHDPLGPINNYAYEVIGVGHHTEDDHRPEDENMVVYQPLYEAAVYKAGRLFDIRPLEMFLEEVVKDGNKISRFQKITDPKTIEELKVIRSKMYDL